MANNIAEQIGEQAAQITVQEFMSKTNEISDIDSHLLIQNIKIAIDEFKLAVLNYEALTKWKPQSNVNAASTKLQFRKDCVYDAFFKVQNLINQYLGQKITITYVHVDPTTGMREIRLVDNDIEHITEMSNINNKGTKYSTLKYQVDANYAILKNSLPQEEDRGLQETAQLAEKRYTETKKIVYWNIQNRFAAYRFFTKGPINEAFVNFYVNFTGRSYFNQDQEHNLATFVMHKTYGAKQADSKNGFLIGDTSIGGSSYHQLAVKGAGGGPQGYKAVFKALSEFSANMSDDEVDIFLRKTLQEKLYSHAHSLIKDTGYRNFKDFEEFLKTI